MLESTTVRFLIIVIVALAAHWTTVLVRGGSRRLLRSRMDSEAKVLTVTGFATSVVVFAIYFAAFGFVLSELGVSLTTSLASASVIGLAVSFGSQGLVQDVITGLTVVFSDLIDVGDMVDIGGQVGIVEGVGMRFTVLVNFSGAGVLLLPPSVEGRHRTQAGYSYLRIKFRIWPGQGVVLESAARPAVAQALRGLEPQYADWMVTVHYRAEPRDATPGRELPRPKALDRTARSRGTSRPGGDGRVGGV